LATRYEERIECDRRYANTEALPLKPRIEEHFMATKDKVKNTTETTKGKIKEATGTLTGSAKLKHDGKIDQVKGNAKKAGEKVKDAFR
jgi:uncharacterized protein YjbJ (UPF0337 family)